MERRKKRPTKIELDDEAEELVITWKEGSESRLALSDLRRNCPCATCRSQHAQSETATDELLLLDVAKIRTAVTARGFDYVGRYGIRITWADGHDTGIYTLEDLRAQAEATGIG